MHVREIASSIDRHLRQHNYGVSITTDTEFGKLQDVIKTKPKKLKRGGKGNLEKRANPLTVEDINRLFEHDQLGDKTPESLLRTIWFLNTVCVESRNTIQ